MNTIRVENPEVIRTEFADISIIDVDGAFKSFTGYFLTMYEDEFEMVTKKLGRLGDEQDNVRMRVYTYDPNHDGTEVMVIKTYDDEIQAEIEELDWEWHNLIVS
jgi:uncharacterized protein YrzB (UPF0473 family)